MILFRFSVNVCVANLPDLIVDYPNARLYANEIFTEAVKRGVMTAEEQEKYTKHVQNMEGF